MGPDASATGRERRTSNRRLPRTGIRVILRAGSLGLGPDLATGLLDVSEDGLCVKLKSSLRPGSEAEIILEKVGSSRPMKLMADIRWCVPDAAGGFRAGVRLRKRLPYKELMDLASNRLADPPPVVTPESPGSPARPG